MATHPVRSVFANKANAVLASSIEPDDEVMAMQRVGTMVRAHLSYIRGNRPKFGAALDETPLDRTTQSDRQEHL